MMYEQINQLCNESGLHCLDTLRTCFLLVYSALAASILPVATGIGIMSIVPHTRSTDGSMSKVWRVPS
jgi:hypothetical protein